MTHDGNNDVLIYLQRTNWSLDSLHYYPLRNISIYSVLTRCIILVILISKNLYLQSLDIDLEETSDFQNSTLFYPEGSWVSAVRSNTVLLVEDNPVFPTA